MTIPRNLSFLAQGASATGVLSVPYGGTGLTSLTAGYIPYGNGTGAFNSSSSLYFNGTNLGIGTTSTVNLLTVANASNQNDSYGNIQAVYTGTTTSANSSVTVKNYQVTGQFMAWDTIGMRIGSRIVTNTGQGNIIFTSGNDSEFMRGFASGGVSIGNTTDPGATNLSVTGTAKASGGVLLGSSTTPLNDYQEGTWTPTDLSGAGLTFTVDHAVYTKIGNLVTANAYITFPATASVANAVITLPYTAAKYDVGSAAATTGNVYSSITVGATNAFTLRSINLTTLTNVSLSGSQVLISITYTV